MNLPEKNIDEIIRNFSELCARLRDPGLSAEERSKLEQYFNECYPQLFGKIKKTIAYKFSSTFSTDLIEEIAQDVIVNKIIAMPEFFHSDVEYPQALLNTVIFNRCIDELRIKPSVSIETLEIDQLPKAEDSLTERTRKKGDKQKLQIEVQEDPILKRTIEEKVIPELGEVCIELLHGKYCLGKTVEQMKLESKNPQSIYNDKLNGCVKLLEEMLKKQGVMDADLEVLEKYLCEALEKFSNPSP